MIMNVPGPDSGFFLAMTGHSDFGNGGREIDRPPRCAWGGRIYCNPPAGGRATTTAAQSPPVAAVRTGAPVVPVWVIAPVPLDVLTGPARAVMMHGRNERCDRPCPRRHGR